MDKVPPQLIPLESRETTDHSSSYIMSHDVSSTTMISDSANAIASGYACRMSQKTDAYSFELGITGLPTHRFTVRKSFHWNLNHY